MKKLTLEEVSKLLGVQKEKIEGTQDEISHLVRVIEKNVSEKGEDYVRENAKFILNRWEDFKGMNLV